MIKHIEFIKSKNLLIVLDQRKLPEKEDFLNLSNGEEIAVAIENLTVRGAPLIGIVAAYGVVCEWTNLTNNISDISTLKQKISIYTKRLAKTRPTAVNLFWAIKIMQEIISNGNSIKKISEELTKKAFEIHENDINNNKLIGKYGAEILKNCKNILTHCNAGALATGGYGTAVGVIKALYENNNNLHVWVDETRPVLQGSRLTAYELLKAGISHTVICDNMAGFLMSQGKVDGVVVGADRIAANGDAANKIGSYSLSVLAKYHNLPFVVAAPWSTIDLSIKSGSDIPIETRDENEIKISGNKLLAPKGSPIYNPAFDVIPKELITGGIVTEKGIFSSSKS